MKSLEKIAEKYRDLEHNQDNYEVGGGLDGNKFASNRHEDASNDEGKLTYGKACQLFKRATKKDLAFVKEVIGYAAPNMEWHHAGQLPKSYGGGMKKTYFLKSSEIVDLAENWNSYQEQIEIFQAEKRIEIEKSKTLEEIKQKFLKKYAVKIERSPVEPPRFYETDREMKGKRGWFCSYGKSYNLTEYYTGWKFRSERKMNEFKQM